jgi:hypothetical protein
MTVVDQAENVGGVVSAARLREGFMRRRANASSEEERAALSDAIGTLEVRFPELEDLPAGGAERFARERGHGKNSRSPSHEGRSRRSSAARRPDAAPLEKGARKSGKPATPPTAPASGKPKSSGPSSTSTRAGSGRRGTSGAGLNDRIGRRTQRAYRETGIPAAGASTSRIVMSALGGTVGLVGVFLLLSSAERGGTAGKAIPAAFEWLGGFLQRVVAPVDFFGHALTPTEAAAAENPHGRAAARQGALETLPRVKGPVKPGLGIRPAQLGFKKEVVR